MGDAVQALFKDPILYESLTQYKPTFWANPHHGSLTEGLPLKRSDMERAHQRWERFAPLIAKIFKKEAPSGKVISPLMPLSTNLGLGAGARSFLKADSDLPICGAVKARGGFFEVF